MRGELPFYKGFSSSLPQTYIQFRPNTIHTYTGTSVLLKTHKRRISEPSDPNNISRDNITSSFLLNKQD